MQCPGQDSRYWDSEAIFEGKCTKCNEIVEFFKDDNSRKCKNCGTKVLNPRIDFGCATYCPYAEQCLGSLPPELLAMKKDLLKDRVAIEMKRYFDGDFKRIGHATRVARHAGAINKIEQGNTAVILNAAYLHDIGIKEAEHKFNSASPRYQHQEGPPVAREILAKLGADQEVIDEVCDIIGHHHHPRENETLNFKVLYDADLIANLEDKHKESPITGERCQEIINKSFLTGGGKQVAQEVFAQMLMKP
ncbi:MAG: HD domain-containing protein [Proteobacteria bacterium]|nr:HD domain-containing protein [Pseudomonadota bacterium]